MTTTLQALDWPTMLGTPMTRWYLDRESWDCAGQCAWHVGCPAPVVAYVAYRVVVLPGDSLDLDAVNCDESGLACAAHLPAIIEYVTGEPLVSGTVVEVAVDPALLRLTGVDPAFVEAKFNKHALGCAA